MAGNSNLFLGPRGKHVAAPKEYVGHNSHGGGDVTTGHTHPGNIARDGKPKNVHPVMVHAGMTRQQNGKTVTLSSIPDASNPNVADPTKTWKRFAVPAVTFGMRSRPDRGHIVEGLSDRILNEAFGAGGPDHPADLGKLPNAVTEE